MFTSTVLSVQLHSVDCPSIRNKCEWNVVANGYTYHTVVTETLQQSGSYYISKLQKQAQRLVG